MPRPIATLNADRHPDLRQEMAQAYIVHDMMNQLLLEHLDVRAWRAKLPAVPGKTASRTRTIADIFAHVHNMRRKWLRLSAPHIRLPARLDRRRCMPKQARAALAESALRCSEMLAEMLPANKPDEALTASRDREQNFLRDGWARPWRPGAAMFAYMISHDAHHRGQACMLAHQLGFRLPVAVMAGIWGWEKLFKQSGFQLPAATKVKSRTR